MRVNEFLQRSWAENDNVTGGLETSGMKISVTLLGNAIKKTNKKTEFSLKRWSLKWKVEKALNINYGLNL